MFFIGGRVPERPEQLSISVGVEAHSGLSGKSFPLVLKVKRKAFGFEVASQALPSHLSFRRLQKPPEVSGFPREDSRVFEAIGKNPNFTYSAFCTSRSGAHPNPASRDRRYSRPRRSRRSSGGWKRWTDNSMRIPLAASIRIAPDQPH